MRLLSRTIRLYFFYSFIILLITIPLFYFIIKRIISEDVDKDLIAQKEDIVRKLDRATWFDPFDLLNALEPDINLAPSQDIRLHDTLYTAMMYNRLTKETTPYRILTSNVIIRGQYYVIQLKSSLVNNEDLIRSIVLVQAILLLLIGAGLLFINRTLSEQVWNPFYATLRRLQHYKVEQDNKVQFEPTNIAEFNDLNRTIEQLTERNYQVYQSQKEFTENAAHEMQTPLAILQTNLELLMQTQPLTEEQAQLITSMADTNIRLSRLNQSLLLLTKIENNQYSETEEVDAVDSCQKALDQLSHQADVKQIRITTDYQQPVQVKTNKALFDILVSNLISNAIRYNYEGGLIKITCNSKALSVQNTSHTPILDKEKIFERFHKEGSHSQSIGLGLAIVKKISGLYGFRIEYNYTDALHTFRVYFS